MSATHATLSIFMKNYLLSKKSNNSNGGRPMKLGQLDFGETGGRGLFCGYDPEGRKVLINSFDLQDLLKTNYMDYKISVRIEKVSAQFSALKFIAKFLIPNNFKKQIIQGLQNSDSVL